MLLKCNEENTTFVICVRKYQVSFWNRKCEPLEKKKRFSETVLQEILLENKFPELNAEEAKLKRIIICIRNSANKIRENWGKYRWYLCPAFVLVYRSASFPLWVFYFTTLKVKKCKQTYKFIFSVKAHVHCVCVCLCTFAK